MGSLGLLSWGLIASTWLASLMIETIHVAIFGLSPCSLGTRSFSPVTILTLFSYPPLPLALCGTSVVQRPRLAVDAVVHIWYPLIRVVADDVLPRLASFAKHRAAIVFIERTDAFDGIRLFFIGRDRVGKSPVGGRRAQRSGDRIRIRGGVRDGKGGGICHSLTDYPLSGHRMGLLWKRWRGRPFTSQRACQRAMRGESLCKSLVFNAQMCGNRGRQAQRESASFQAQ